MFMLVLQHMQMQRQLPYREGDQVLGASSFVESRQPVFGPEVQVGSSTLQDLDDLHHVVQVSCKRQRAFCKCQTHNVLFPPTFRHFSPAHLGESPLFCCPSVSGLCVWSLDGNQPMSMSLFKFTCLDSLFYSVSEEGCAPWSFHGYFFSSFFYMGFCGFYLRSFHLRSAGITNTGRTHHSDRC